MASVTENRDRLTLQSLADERRHHSTIIQPHTRAERVKDPNNAGLQLVLHPVPECADTVRADVEPEAVALADLDHDPATFTIDTSALGLGPHLVRLDCSAGVTAQTNVEVYRQTGAARGEADSIVLAGGMGLASAAAVVGLPAIPLVTLRSRRRR